MPPMSSAPLNPPPPRDAQPHGPLAWLVHNRVTPNLMMLVLLVGGVLTALSIKQEVFPEFSADQISIRVAYPGAGPEEVENGIILVIEEAVRAIEGIVEMQSTAREGSADVMLEIEPNGDHQKIYTDVQQAIARIRTFPDDAEEPQIELVTRRRDVLEVQLYGDVDEFTLRNIAEEVRDRLLQDEGITQIDFEGTRDFEIHVNASQETLRRYGLTLQQIADLIARNAVEVPAGAVDAAAGEILVRFDERRDWAAEFARIPIITTPDGSIIHLGDIATVREAFEDIDAIATYNGRRAIGLEIYRIGDQTPLQVSRAARRVMAEVESSLPDGVSYVIHNDRSDMYHQRLQLLLKNGAMGLGLVMLMLGMFLELRLALWVTVTIPVSFLGAFLFLPLQGVTLNMMSMFAFIIALGIVVDNAIVVGENIYQHRERGLSPTAAAIHGVREVAMPVAFSVLTNIVTFVPLLFIPGTMGKMWRAVPLVVVTVFIVCWLEAVLILPTHLAQLQPHSRNPILHLVLRGQQAISRLLRRAIYGLYAPLLDACMRLRYLVVACGLGLLALVSSYALSGRMGMTLMPKVEADQSVVTATLPIGSPHARAVAVRDRLEAAAWEIIHRQGGDRLSEGIFSNINEHSVNVRVLLTDADVRPISTTAFTDLWRNAVGQIAGLESLRFESDRGGPGGGSSITVELAHAEVPTLERAGERLAEYLEEFPSVSDIDDGYEPGKEQLDFTLTEEGRGLGLTVNDVARQVRAAFEGVEALKQQRGRNEITVRVQYPQLERASEYDIEQIMIRTPGGAFVPLRQVARVDRGRAYTSIQRRDGRRTISVTANVQPDEMTNQVLAALTNDVLPRLAADFPGLAHSFQGRQSDMRESLGSLRIGFIIALFAIYILLAIPFRSYIQPLVVMFAIPFGVVGAIIGHMLMDYSLSVISLMGIIALGGVVINGSLIMIVFANEARAAGHSAFQAMHLAGVRRFLPIMLTTLTTFGGLAPMIFETSRQARFMIPMAISLGYGLLFATAITLILIPSLYMIIEDFLGLFGRADDESLSHPGRAEKDPLPHPEPAPAK